MLGKFKIIDRMTGKALSDEEMAEREVVQIEKLKEMRAKHGAVAEQKKLAMSKFKSAVVEKLGLTEEEVNLLFR